MNSYRYSRSAISLVQKEKFSDLIPHFNATPLINQKLKNHGYLNGKLKSISQIGDLPFMTKEELRSTSIQDRSPFGMDQLEYIFSSSGTSGEPTKYFWTKNDTSILKLAGRLAMQRIGVTPSDLAMIIAPYGMPIMSYCMNNQYNLVGTGVLPIGLQTPDVILEIIKNIPVSIMTTLPVYCTRLMDFYLMNHKNGKVPGNLRQCHVGGDYLSEGRRHRIEEIWNVDCYNFYGLSEIFGPIAGECKEKNGMHFLSDYLYLEVLDPETLLPVEEGTAGVAVYTTLWEKGAPLLRYWSGDFVSVFQEECICGDHSPKIKFHGKLFDSVVINGKRIFPSGLEDILFKFPVGDEFSLELNSGSKGLLKIEKVHDMSLPTNQIEQEFSDFLKVNCKVLVLETGSFSREIPKPARIVIQN